ncbi:MULTISPECIES: Y4bD/Y4pK family protein [Bradyrhizobium]|uniref:Y4bD/Y4pK family protein n=1 Tax=Bradyrhizobium centrosematis TaxID=1300039 RepID=UPI002169E598|nr:Y4bD/Y4pK family protein [Bradyrhizobium centrosematis]
MDSCVLPTPGETASQCRVSAFEVLILYPFHPRAGQMVQVEHRKRFAGEDRLVMVQPDGTLALIPAWMNEDIARSATLTASPQLAVERLVELRARIDAYCLSRRGMAPAKEGIMQPMTPLATEPEEHRQTPAIPASQRSTLVRLIEGLLVEALAAGTNIETGTPTAETREAAHEPGHA